MTVIEVKVDGKKITVRDSSDPIVFGMVVALFLCSAYVALSTEYARDCAGESSFHCSVMI